MVESQSAAGERGEQPKRREPEHPAETAGHAAVVPVERRSENEERHADDAGDGDQCGQLAAAVVPIDSQQISPASESRNTGVSEKMPWWPMRA